MKTPIFPPITEIDVRELVRITGGGDLDDGYDPRYRRVPDALPGGGFRIRVYHNYTGNLVGSYNK